MYMQTKWAWTTGLVVALATGTSVHTQTINLDFGLGPAYDGDNGVLSSPGGTIWNAIPSSSFRGPVVDEFGNPSGVQFSYGDLPADQSDVNATNTLQDTGITDTRFFLSVARMSLYDIAVYTQGVEGVTVQGLSADGVFGSVTPTYALPGVEAVPGKAQGDYLLFRSVQAQASRGGGGFLEIASGSAVITGLQAFEVPEPSSGLVLLAFSGLALRRRAL